METVIRVVMLAALATATWRWIAAFPAVRSTSLLAAWRWGLAASLGGLAAAATPLAGLGQGSVDHLWFATGVLWLCPAVSVLGARRPGSTAWGVFIVFPLLFVLEWPVTGSEALAAWWGGVSGGTLFRPVVLEWPTVIGFAVVLVMGTGNYLGTRFAMPALAWAAGLVLLLWPLTPWGAGLEPGFRPPVSRVAGAVLLAVAAVWAAAPWRSSPIARDTDRLDQAWLDFQDTFGVVWALRVQERVNQDLRRLEDRGDGGRLGPGGLEFPTDTEPEPAVRAAVSDCAEVTLRRLWKRFVDPDWITRRLGDQDVGC